MPSLHILRTAALLSFAVWAAPAAAAEPAAPEPEAGDAKFFTDFTWQTFRDHPPAQARIDMEKIDHDLLSAAVFHETNRRRENEGLPTLLHHPGVRGVALMQAKIMAERGSISHVNPKLPEKETPADRFRLAGLKLAFAAENVATAFGLEYTSGKPVYVRTEDGKKRFSREPDGMPLPMHTYLTFADDLLEGWMNSPGHRANIVSTDPQFLGASSRPSTNDIGMPMFYCAQVFYTPLPTVAPPPPPAR